MSGEDESPKDYFHLVYGVVLENFSELHSGKQHVVFLGQSVIWTNLTC